jgi:LysM repeat protein
VQPGESLAQLAQRFQTTEAVLEAVNGRGPAQPLLAGELLVVPAGLSAPGGLPVFSVLYLKQSRSLAAVASEYATTEEALRRYNALGAGAQLPVGRWLIVPVAGD